MKLRINKIKSTNISFKGKKLRQGVTNDVPDNWVECPVFQKRVESGIFEVVEEVVVKKVSTRKPAAKKSSAKVEA